MNLLHHTPGPWVATMANGREPITVAAREEPTIVAEALWQGSQDEQIANARLITAAPELLAALRLALAEIHQFHSTAYPRCDGGCPAHEALAVGQAAIAAATGEARS